MRNMQIKLIENLKSGEWVIEMIAPSFLRKIPKKFSDYSLDIYSYYNQVRDLDINKVFERELRDKLKNSNIELKNKSYPLDISFFLKTENEEINNLVDKYFKYVCIVSGVDFMGASHPQLWGKIILNIKLLTMEKNVIVNSIVHEMAHQELFLLNLVDRLVLKQFDNNLEFAPYQNMSRPPIGRLHSCHALYRMLQYKYSTSKNELMSKFKKNIENLHEYELTQFSKGLIDEVYNPFIRSYDGK